VLQNRFGPVVWPDTKAIKIPAGNGRRSADVIVATDFRRYHRFNTVFDQQYDAGLCFFTHEGERIANYPKDHAKNCTAKHQATKGLFKPCVRILKNLRQRLVDTNVIEAGIAPSYFLEGLMYNVPDNLFGTTYPNTIRQALIYLAASDRTTFVCANRQYYLLGESPVTWPAANCQKFLDAAVQLWDGWRQ
jgi:hypothetical protein